MKTTSSGGGRRWPIVWAMALGMFVGVPCGMWIDGGPGSGDTGLPDVRLPGMDQAFALDPSTMFAEGDGLTFIPFRRNLWVINHEADRIQFFMFPSTEEKPIQPSRRYTIDRTEFPADVVRYQVSDHNLTNFLWVLNPLTGKVRYLKAMRDGKIETSKLLNVNEG